MEWKTYWQNLLTEKKLNAKVDDLDKRDLNILGHEPWTERICKGICSNYEELEKRLEIVKQDCIKELGSIEGVYLTFGRVKTRDSLLCKVIEKRWKKADAFDNKYYELDEYNYNKIITDLIGIRLIMNYRGKWLDVHRKILEIFPLMDQSLYEKKKPLEHRPGEKFQAEWPNVYHAKTDSAQQYKEEGLYVNPQTKGYRSIHYILSYKETYIELQLRTIYDEAWGECDHNYVYKKEANRSHGALLRLSEILNRLTSLSDILNDTMKSVYDKEGIINGKQKETWAALPEHINSIDEIIGKIDEVGSDLKAFRNQLICKQEDCDGTGKKRTGTGDAFSGTD